MTDEERQRFSRRLREANAEIERLTRRLYEVDAQLTAEDHIHARENMALRAEKDAEIERLTAVLQRIADDGKNCADHCRRQARRALEPKP